VLTSETFHTTPNHSTRHRLLLYFASYSAQVAAEAHMTDKAARRISIRSLYVLRFCVLRSLPVPPSQCPQSYTTYLSLVAIRRSHPCEPYVLPPEPLCIWHAVNGSSRLSSHSRSRAQPPPTSRTLTSSSPDQQPFKGRQSPSPAQVCGCRSPCHWASLSGPHSVPLPPLPAYHRTLSPPGLPIRLFESPTLPSRTAVSAFLPVFTPHLEYFLHINIIHNTKEFTSPPSPRLTIRSARSPSQPWRRRPGLDKINYLFGGTCFS